MPAPANEVLGAMITPAVLISASGTLVLSTSNRLSRVVDRVRALAREAEGMTHDPTRAKLLADQLPRLSQRALMLRTAMTVLYSAIGLLVGCSFTIGLGGILRGVPAWLPVGLGILGAGALLHASFLLIREARSAVSSTLQEMEVLEQVLGRDQ
ncbi:MAG TPA: DUF2721 domain-containing protein [Holophagaceae bacterium]|nr:DUF2721 domain-containing protein [Holophagaceae bacterium]